MTWIAWLTIAIFATSIEKIINRAHLAGSQDYWDYMKGYNIGAVAILAAIGLPSLTMPETQTILLLTFSGGLWFLGCLFALRADQYAGVSTTALIAPLQLIVLCIGGVILFQEQVTWPKAIGILCITAGLAAHIRSAKVFNLGVIFKGFSALAMASAILTDKFLSEATTPSVIAMSGFLIPLVVSIAWAPLGTWRSIQYAHRISFVNVGMGAFSAVTYFALVTALSLAPVTLVMPIYQLNIILTLLFGYFILNEKGQAAAKWQTAMAVLIGAIVIQWGF